VRISRHGIDFSLQSGEPERIESVPGYKITYSEIDNQSRTATVLRGTPVELGAVRILDTEFDKRELQSAFRGSAVEPHIRNVHFFTKVEVSDNTLVLSSLSMRWRHRLLQRFADRDATPAQGVPAQARRSA
jgi:hypothetical protein